MRAVLEGANGLQERALLLASSSFGRLTVRQTFSCKAMITKLNQLAAVPDSIPAVSWVFQHASERLASARQVVNATSMSYARRLSRSMQARPVATAASEEQLRRCHTRTGSCSSGTAPGLLAASLDVAVGGDGASHSRWAC